MPPLIVTTIDPAQYRKLQWTLATIPDGARIATYTAINKTAMHGRSLIARSVAEAMTARISSVNKRITVKKASRNRLFATLNLHGKYGVSLIGFSAKQTSTGVTAKVFGQSKDYPHAFIATSLGGGKQVFERQADKRIMQKGRYKGRLRQPLIALKGPTVPETFENTPGLADKAIADMNLTFEQNLNSQIAWLLAKGAPQAQEAA